MTGDVIGNCCFGVCTNFGGGGLGGAGFLNDCSTSKDKSMRSVTQMGNKVTISLFHTGRKDAVTVCSHLTGFMF